MCMCMHKALGGHSFDALLEASSDLITPFGLLEDYGSFARLLKQFPKILLGIFPIKWGYLGTQMACQGYFSTCRSCMRSFYSEVMPHDFLEGDVSVHHGSWIAISQRQVVGMGVSFVNWRVVSSCFPCFPKSFLLGCQVLVEVTSLFYNEQKTNNMLFERNAYACIR